jgi:hypothetical protein
MSRTGDFIHQHSLRATTPCCLCHERGGKWYGRVCGQNDSQGVYSQGVALCDECADSERGEEFSVLYLLARAKTRFCSGRRRSLAAVSVPLHD